MYGSILYNLETQLRAMRLPHPYRLARGQMDQLLTTWQFANGGSGTDGNGSLHYIYHLTSVRKVLTYGDWQYTPAGFPSDKYSDRRLFEYLIDDYNYAKEWLPLSYYAQDRYSGFRNFTWWTDLEILAASVICSCHKLGLPNKWVPKYALVMRCSAEYAKTRGLKRVPTTMDGFISEIFSPSDFRPPLVPDSGKAIDLDSAGRLREGYREYSLQPIPVQEIEFIPLLIEGTMRRQHVVARNGRLWQRLETYYNGL